ncbi:family 16 glycosylhydrolase, partial [Nocardioides sp.]|uniref:family 16 glycosylhydrolase n=1 Tax=Nocardioides sp. TaxID=35761 RepID=UPI00286A2C3D
DTHYCIRDQLFVQPDSRLSDCFDPADVVRMSRQEVAVARSHIEVWKAIASGGDSHVLVLEDDVWFRRGAKAVIERGWRCAVGDQASRGVPKLVYLSYVLTDVDARRRRVRSGMFPVSRGVWFMSGYVLSRDGAAHLLRSMPVVGPVDMWMNYRLVELNAVAVSSSVLAQRTDSVSDNSYSILPYLARAGVVDVERAAAPPPPPSTGSVLGWTTGGETETLSMALSMLGLRVRAFNGDEEPLDRRRLDEVLQTFDALVDPPIVAGALSQFAAERRAVVCLEHDAYPPPGLGGDDPLPPVVRVPGAASAVGCGGEDRSLKGSHRREWAALCSALAIDEPTDPYPAGVPRSFGAFRDGRTSKPESPPASPGEVRLLDESPWVLPEGERWLPQLLSYPAAPLVGECVVSASMRESSKSFRELSETFPGNRAEFVHRRVAYGDEGAHLNLDVSERGHRPYLSGAFASRDSFIHGRFEAAIKSASGSGLVTGFFLHRSEPRQEIDIEFIGAHPTRMLTNVYFNPGDDLAAFNFGYRGSPAWIDLGFDASADFHVYAIDWQPDCISWLVDGVVVHRRASWDPTPVPHLAMHLHANLWAPRSAELAGPMDERCLPAQATFRDVGITR